MTKRGWAGRRTRALLAAGLLGACPGCEPAPEVQVSVDAPTTVRKGQRFTVTARARNEGAARHTLVDLDVADSYLKGIVIEKAEPPFSEAMHVPIDNSMSYTFNQAIDPGGERVVLFHAFAAHAGDHAGDIDFCIDSSARCRSIPIRTIVE